MKPKHHRKSRKNRKKFDRRIRQSAPGCKTQHVRRSAFRESLSSSRLTRISCLITSHGGSERLLKNCDTFRADDRAATVGGNRRAESCTTLVAATRRNRPESPDFLVPRSFTIYCYLYMCLQIILPSCDGTEEKISEDIGKKDDCSGERKSIVTQF